MELTLKADEAFYRNGTTTNVLNNGVGLLGLKGMEEVFVSMSTRSDIPSDYFLAGNADRSTRTQ